MQLNKFQPTDAKRVAYLANDKSIARWTANIPHPYSEADAQQWITRINAGGQKSDQRHAFAIQVNDEIVGCISYWNYDQSTIEIGYWVGKDYHGKGIASQAVRLLLASSNLPANSKVVAKTMADNIASQQVLIKCGFQLVKPCQITKQGEQIAGLLFAYN